MKHLPLIKDTTAEKQVNFLKEQNADGALAFVESKIEELNNLDTSDYNELQTNSFNAWMAHWTEVKTLLQ